MRKLQGLIQNPQESPLPNGRAFAPSGIESHRKLDWGASLSLTVSGKSKPGNLLPPAAIFSANRDGAW
jgi:hypothetical protein